MYKATDKIADLMSHEEDAIHVISRFGLGMGVGEQTIAEACALHGVHTPTFLAIVNYKVFKHKALPTEVDVPTLQQYLRNAHSYFLDFRLPFLRRAIIEAIIPADPTSQIPMLILRCYDEFVEEIRTHIAHEEQGLVEEHIQDDQRITDKLSEIKKLIIKYYPSENISQKGIATYTLIHVMSDLWHTEQDFADHCAIEDEILRPALSQALTDAPTATPNQETEALSERERDVLIQVVNGLSNKEIADRLFISIHTVMTHRKNITRKLNIHSTAGLTIYAIVNKLINIDNIK
jgi:regulator of cell morphogenesis and NO signaling